MCKRKKNKFKNILCFAVIALALGAAADPAWDVRAVQLDLARQMETVPFLKRYLSVAKESGYTAVVLYLEGRVRTPSFPYRSREESYSVDEMKEVVAEAQRVGIDVVPVVSVLGHAEFSYFERTVPFCRAQMLDPTRADIVSTVEISLKPEFD